MEHFTTSVMQNSSNSTTTLVSSPQFDVFGHTEPKRAEEKKNTFVKVTGRGKSPKDASVSVSVNST